jgi:hypothetical protein
MMDGTSTDTVTRTGAAAHVPTVDLVLPGRWWRVDLSSEEAARRSSRALARHAVGTRDDAAALRADLSKTVLAAATEARRAAASDFYFALELVPDLSVPAALAVYWPEVPVQVAVEAGPAAAAATLAAHLRDRSAAPAGGTRSVNTWGTAERQVIRVIDRVAPPPGGEPEGDTAADRLAVQYWITSRAHATPLLLQFSTPSWGLDDAIVCLFDAIVEILEWRPTPDTKGAP